MYMNRYIIRYEYDAHGIIMEDEMAVVAGSYEDAKAAFFEKVGREHVTVVTVTREVQP